MQVSLLHGTFEHQDTSTVAIIAAVDTGGDVVGHELLQLLGVVGSGQELADGREELEINGDLFLKNVSLKDVNSAASDKFTVY